MSDSLDVYLSATRQDELRFAHTIPDGWQQGRGAFGGLVLGLLTRTMSVVVGDDQRALRNLTGQICGPVQPGEIAIVVEKLRIGNAVSTLRATLSQSGEVQAAAVGVFGPPRQNTAGTERDHLTPHASPPWRDEPVVRLPSPPAPIFLQHFDVWPTGALPFSGTAMTGPSTAWARPRVPCAIRDAAYLVAQADILWPATLTQLAVPRPMATIGFTFDVLGNLEGLDERTPLHHSGEVLASRDGFAVEQRQLRGGDGRLVALNQQTFVVIK